MNTPLIIIWKHHLSVGVADVDDDHKKLIKMINRLFGATLSSQPGAVLQGVLDELTDYVVRHFAREEDYMLRLGFSDYQAHKEDHHRLIESVGVFTEQILSGVAFNIKDQIEHILRDWLVTHIQVYDKQMGQFLNEQGIR
ncbi:MAG: bacteriohemerythrin [Magnetococcus sp. YQC-5]